MTTLNKSNIKRMEREIMFFQQNDFGEDLPGTVSEDEAIAEVICGETGKSYFVAEAELHHQIDPSYQ